jgi:methionyl-tRNA synthetase
LPKFYLTTAIDYSNGEPHLGHALEKVGADCIARYHRLRGDAVHFLMGMDEHSQSVIQAATRSGMTPQAWVDRMADTFAGYWRRLGCSHDDWIRTTEPRHVRSVTALLERIRQRRPQDLFEAEYEGLYCTGCEEFKTGAQIVDGHCVEHPTLELIPTRERNHFFRLSAYRDTVLERIRSGALSVEPEIRRNEVVRLLEAGLQDISISRQRQSWGIPFPGDPQQTVYVWFDALINYLSATGFPEADFERLWPADLHVIGKGITRFHAVYWLALLLSAGQPLPSAIYVHEYLSAEGVKLSKSTGNAVSPYDLAGRFGTDAVRWWLLRDVARLGDTDFTAGRLVACANSDLANGLGNLQHRTLTLVHRYRAGRIDAPAGAAPLGAELADASQALPQVIDDALARFDFRAATGAICSVVQAGNRLVETQRPWDLARRERQGDRAAATRLDELLGVLTEACRVLASELQPFIPAGASALSGQLPRG